MDDQTRQTTFEEKAMRFGRTLWIGAAGAGLAAAAAASPAPMLGFTPAQAQAERALEARFDAGLSASEISDRLQRMAAEPNQVSSPHDKENAEFTLAQYKSWGWDAHIEVFSVLYPTPKAETLELLGPSPYTATLTEPPIPGDATSAHTAGELPGFNAYGADGDVTAPLVYVNYGGPADYAQLQRLGVDVKGKIVIARYGSLWRGLKPKLAYEHGAVGCIIYSDPADDGYGVGDPYPAGPARPERGIQRGSVEDMPVRAGDPLTPNIGATENAPRIARADAEVLVKIPVLPISWGDAQHFLAALDGPVAPKAWRGALALTYHVGPGASVHLAVQSNWDQKPIYDVIATIKGSEFPDQWVIRGNHRDGWVFGAEDPLAGQTAEMQEAKSIGALLKSGWRPKRTIVYASWDGEEPGLLGSTEWAEMHATTLQDKAVLYVNSDTNDRGLIFDQASYSLRRLLDQAAADVRDPETGASVRDRALASVQVRALEPGATEETKDEAKSAAAGGDIAVGDLGSGSDYSAFVQHLGIASIDFGFGGEGQSGGVYHSAYDTFEHYQKFGDPGMVYGVVLAKTGGRLILRTADADLLPMAFDNLARTVGVEVEQLKKLAASERTQSETVDRLLDQKAFALAADPTKPWGAPDREVAVPNIDFSPLDDAVAKLTASARAYDRAASAPKALDARQLAAVNAILQGLEQAMTDSRGLPGRPWYRHLIYSPGLLTGYGAKTLPGVREAIEGRRWAESADFIARTAQALNTVATRLDMATAMIGG
ncbi:MAG TPA: transferrin receptor-like dimerization domain-containing protein [Caulobacteraceae bacterium]